MWWFFRGIGEQGLKVQWNCGIAQTNPNTFLGKSPLHKVPLNTYLCNRAYPHLWKSLLCDCLNPPDEWV